VLCLRAFRSSVPSNVRLESMARRTASQVPLPMLKAELVRRVWGDGPSGRGQFARVILTGCCLDAGAGGTRRAGTGPVLEPGTNFLEKLS